MKNYYVYMLKCSDNSYYIGHTRDLEARFAEHNNMQGGRYTSSRLPTQMVFAQEFATQNDAFAIERQIKGWTRDKKEALISKDWNLIKNLSKKIFEKN
jgi:tRNA/rRNA methyltransferase